MNYYRSESFKYITTKCRRYFGHSFCDFGHKRPSHSKGSQPFFACITVVYTVISTYVLLIVRFGGILAHFLPYNP